MLKHKIKNLNRKNVSRKNVSVKYKKHKTYEIIKKNKTQKHCYNDNDIVNVCTSGKFTTISSQGLYTKQSLKKFISLF